MVKLAKNKWSNYVTQHSNVLDLESGVFTWRDPQKIAESLQRSALASTRRKGSLLQSAMSMINFYINRAGKKLNKEQKNKLIEAKDRLRALFTDKT